VIERNFKRRIGNDQRSPSKRGARDEGELRVQENRGGDRSKKKGLRQGARKKSEAVVPSMSKESHG